MNKFRERRIDNRQREYAQRVNQERRRKRRKKNYLIHYILIFILVTVIGVILSLTVFFNINKIVINGNSNLVTNDQIIGFTKVSEGQNLFRINLEKIEKRIIENTTDIDSVNVKRGLPDKLIIDLEPSQAKLAYYNNGKYYLISQGNRVINVVDSLDSYPDIIKFSSADLKDIKVGDFLTDNEAYEDINKLISHINKVGLNGIKAIEIKSNGDIKLDFENRITIELGNMVEIDYKLKTVNKVLTEYVDTNTYGVIDAKTETVAYFRPMSREKQIESGKVVKVE